MNLIEQETQPYAASYRKGFIYKITNSVNGKIYIGKTFKTPELRFRVHSRGYFAISRAIKKYGLSNFTLSVIDNADNPAELSCKETMWIELFGSFGPRGYNLTVGGEGVLGLKFSEESRKKLSESHRGQIAWNKGKPFSIESRRRMSESHKNQKPRKGYKTTPEQRKRNSESHMGIGHTKESCHKISEGLKVAYRNGERQLGMKHRRWINCGSAERVISANDTLPSGWKFGRLPDVTRSRSLPRTP